MLETRPLGRSELQVSPIGLGCVTFGREIDEEQSFRIMDHALEKSITFFDTAEVYGGGQARASRQREYGVEDEREVTDEMNSSELIIGRWMRARGTRNDVTVCTKSSVGDGTPESIARAVEGSCERLQVDSIDVYKMHSWCNGTPIDATIAGLAAVADARKVKVIGSSNYSADQLQEALDASAASSSPRMEIVQIPYNLARPPTSSGHTSREDVENEIMPLCRREEIAVSIYSPLGAGFLTGKYVNDKTKFPERTRFHVSPAHADIYFTERNFRIVNELRRKSEQLSIPMVRLAMAFAMTHPAVTTTWVGAREIRHLDSAIESYELGLEPELRAELAAWG